MFRVESTVWIQKSVEAVYTFVNNPDSITRWQGRVERVKFPDGIPVVGTQYTEVRKFMGRKLHSTLEVTAIEANKRCGAKVIKGPLTYEFEVTFAEEGEGTKLTMVVAGEPEGFFKLAEGMLIKQLELSVDEDCQRLKSLLEGW